MGVKHIVKTDHTREIASAMKELNGRAVEVGVFNGEHAWLAHIHEFGCTITVTPKMREYLHATGLHLKPETLFIRIPERSFLRGGYDEKKQEVMREQEVLLKAVAGGDLDAGTFLDTVGTILAGKIKEFAVDLRYPPLHHYTLKQRHSGGSNPLVDTGDMIGSITHRVR